MTNAFLAVLKHYEPKKVIQAVKEWVVKSPEFPTPSDIVAIVENRPKLDHSIYIQAQKVAGDFQGKFSKSWDRQTAKEYCQYYERETIGKVITR